MASVPKRLFTLELQPPYHVKRLLPFCLAILIAASTHAQVSIGNRLGMALSHQESDDALILDHEGAGPTPLLGLSSALVIEAKIKPFIAAQVELGWTQKGRQNSESGLSDFYRMRLNYGEGQLLAKGIIGKGPVKLNILAGISLGRGLVATELGEYSEFDNIKVVNADTLIINQDTATYTIDTTATFPHERKYVDRFLPFNKTRDGGLAITETSLVGGLGVSFDLGRSRVFIEGRYVKGMTAIYNGKLNEPDVFNSSILFQFGYLVQLNDPKKDASAKPEAPQY